MQLIITCGDHIWNTTSTILCRWVVAKARSTEASNYYATISRIRLEELHQLVGMSVMLGSLDPGLQEYSAWDQANQQLDLEDCRAALPHIEHLLEKSKQDVFEVIKK